MKISHICIIFYCLAYIAQLTACPTCVSGMEEHKREHQSQSQE